MEFDTLIHKPLEMFLYQALKQSKAYCSQTYGILIKVKLLTDCANSLILLLNNLLGQFQHLFTMGPLTLKIKYCNQSYSLYSIILPFLNTLYIKALSRAYSKMNNTYTASEYYSCIKNARAFCEGQNLCLPKTIQKKGFDRWVMMNSSRLKPIADNEKCPQGSYIPLTVCTTVLAKTGLKEIEKITDTEWLKNMAYKLMTEGQREKTIFKFHDSEVIEGILQNSERVYAIDAEILPELAEYGKNHPIKLLPGLRGPSRNTHPPTVLSYHLLEKGNLKQCILCTKLVNGVSILSCCKRIVHKHCIKNYWKKNPNSCPNKCVDAIVKTIDATKYEHVFSEKANDLVSEMKALEEKLAFQKKYCG
eukprot:TRINITY_DN18169_c0_g1_i1.p1 TRINITY_DN18169_c0_g1~~TRINITY_DN18169_c0_g1_i1.p1  ORF type:complete len:399 (-),score=-0.71 TRINITY_DN18169_c0_g1_i1:175-1260(-)